VQQLVPRQTLAHAPQLETLRAAPQLSVPLNAPHTRPLRLQKVASLSGEQPQTLVARQVPPSVQVPQASVRPPSHSSTVE
jgi:hypothetical protein